MGRRPLSMSPEAVRKREQREQERERLYCDGWVLRRAVEKLINAGTLGEQDSLDPRKVGAAIIAAGEAWIELHLE